MPISVHSQIITVYVERRYQPSWILSTAYVALRNALWPNIRKVGELISSP